MKYLLAAQTLLQLIDANPTKAKQWVETVAVRDLRVSVISQAQAYAEIEQLAVASERQSARIRLDMWLARVYADAEPTARAALVFDGDDARAWASLLCDPNLEELYEVDRMVYAMALARGMTVVEDAGPLAPQLVALGVKLHTW